MNQPLGPGQTPSAPPPPPPGSIPARRSREGADSNTGGFVQKLKDLPRPVQVVLGVALFGLVYLTLGGRGGSEAPQGSTNSTNAQALQQPAGANPSQVFNGLESDRPILMQNWLEQNRREISGLKDAVNQQFQQRDQTLSDALQQNSEMQREMRQMMTDFTSEIRNMQAGSERDRETINQLAEEQKKMQLNAPVDGTSGGNAADPSALPRRQERINQTPLGGVSLNTQGAPAPSAGGMGQRVSSVANDGGADTPPPPLPFVPPLGFIKATMLNGVDALVGGQPTPALVRLQGTYKTAMNTTVTLDGCYALVEFQGEVSTERAVGKPARMTCVYPDQGVSTYALSGYVVDAEDGIIGVPGVFYEGDASRIAAAMMADFAAGLSAAVEANNNTFALDQNGNAIRTISGQQGRTAVAGGANKATQSLRDYLMERVNRVLPFIRLDSTRELHLVLLSGTELRTEGSPWTTLFDAETADSARAGAPLNQEPPAQNAQGPVNVGSNYGAGLPGTPGNAANVTQAP